MHKIWLLISLFALIPSLVWAGDADESSPVTYFAMKPSIVTNLTGGPKFIRTDIQLLTREDRLDDVKLHVPSLRHELLMLLSEQDGNSLLTPNGKESFRQSALAALQTILKKRTGTDDLIIEDLYFTSFYVK